MRPAFSCLVPFALAATLVVTAGAGCVTRTVYVVDDDPRPQAAPPTSRGDVAAPSAGGSAGMYAVEEEAGIRDESDFYEPLAPYGRWVVYPSYGRVWVPHTHVVGAGFRPYTHGHWEMTEWGWTWVDHHPFGWATGHYGRWFYDSSYGWVWVPGRVWSPAWVSWRTGGGYVGWAPMPPGAYYGGAYTVYDTSWVFVSYSGFGYGYVGSMLVVGPAYRTCYLATSPYRETYVVHGRTYYRGPSEDEITRGGGRVVHRPVREVERERPVTRPPQGTALARNRERSNRDASSASGGARSRDDDASGTSRDRDGTGSDDARGDSRDRDDARGDSRDHRGDDARSIDGLDGRDDNGDDVRGRDGVSTDPRPIDPRETDPRDPRDPRGNLRGDFYRGDAAGQVVEPRPIVVDDNGSAGAPDARPDPRGERGSRVDERPDLRGDTRSPYYEDERPTKRHPENPDRVRDLTPGIGPSDRGPSVYDRSPSPSSRGYDRTPSPSYDRSPSVGRPVGPSIDRGPAPSRAPSPSPSMGSSRGPSGPGPSGPAVSAPSPTPQGEASSSTSKKSSSKKSSGKSSSKSKGK